MKVSANGIALVARFEGFRSCPYRDPVGVWTVGYGETRGVGPRTPCWSQDTALKALGARLSRDYGAAVERAAKRYGLELNQNEFDALASLVYNLGPGILDPGKSMGEAMRRRSRSAMAAAFGVYVFAGGRRFLGLVRRRAAEVALFRKPAETPEQRMVRAWRERLARVRKEASDRKRRGLNPWPAGLHALADELKRNIRTHTK